MAISEAVFPSISEAVPSFASDAEPGSGRAAAPSGRKSVALLMATLLTLGSVGMLGYTQWWVPREQAAQTAQVQYEQCLTEVTVYKGKHSYKDRLAQCTKFLNG